MVLTVLLDSEPLGLLSAPPGRADVQACSQWLVDMASAGHDVVVPEITDYELRRELLRAGKTASLRRLDALTIRAYYLPITTAAMRRAAELWALARQRGRPTSGDKTIDCDVILAAQALTLGAQSIIVATANVAHLSRFLPADEWRNIKP